MDQWPGVYEKHIKHVLKKVPAVEKLFEMLNVPFEVGYYSNAKTVMGDSATIFGGFLRWIVEEVSNSCNPTLRRFLKYGSDIDIMINDYGGCYNKLNAYFRYIFSIGGVIEYAGMTYESNQKSVSIAIGKEDVRLDYGNYIIWIPVNSKNGLSKEKLSEKNQPAKVVRPAPVRPGVSFADALKSKVATTSAAGPTTEPIVCSVITGSEDSNVRADTTEDTTTSNDTTDDTTVVENSRNPTLPFCSAKREWIKLDLSFGCSSINTDFTANALQWPRARGDKESVQYLTDIIARRIVPHSSTINIKTCYRLIKLYRRGYTFGIGDKSDSEYLSRYLQSEMEERSARRKKQYRTCAIFGHAFTGDMCAPSTVRSISPIGTYRYVESAGRNMIVTTRHELTRIDADYMLSIREYHELATSIGFKPRREYTDALNLLKEKSLISTTVPTDNSKFAIVPANPSSFSNFAVPKFERLELKVERTTEPITVYKAAEIPAKDGKLTNGLTVCCILEIPINTAYINEVDVTLYEHAIVEGIYAYPRIRVDAEIQSLRLNVVSSYDKSFKYANKGIISRNITAMFNGKPTPLNAESQHGIYTYKTMLEAWNHYPSSDIAHIDHFATQNGESLR